ncbi:phage tail fiber protein [Achromobacter aegrifaciens]
MATLTSANSVLMLAVGGVFPVPQKIEGYASENSFMFAAVTPAKVTMGVDGRMSASYTPVPCVQTITIQPDSPSMRVFEVWMAACETAREVFYANGTLSIPSIDRKYTLTRGVLTQIPPAPEAKAILQPMAFQITWQNVSPSLV